MDENRRDPQYKLHEDKPPTRSRGGPRKNAPGQEDRSQRSDDSFLEVNKRINMQRSDPEAVREREREHDSPSAPDEA